MSIASFAKMSVRKFTDYILFVYQRFLADDCLSRASALTFTSLLAIVPCMSVGIAVLSAFPAFHKLAAPIENFIFANFVPATGEVIQNYLATFTAQATKLSLWGTLFLLVTVVLVMFTIESAMNRIWRVRLARKGISTVLLYWAVFSLAPILMGISFVVSSYLASLPLLSTTAASFGINKGWLLAWAPFVLAVITFTLLYTAVPNCKVRLRDSLLGAIIAALLIEVAKAGFTVYFQGFNTYQLIYGTFAAIPLFFLWIYWVWLIILLGAELAHGCSVYYERRSGMKLDGFTHAFHWLGYLWQAQLQGQGLTLHALIKLDKHNYQVAPDDQLSVLLGAQLVHTTHDDTIMLSRDLSRMTLADLYRDLPWQLPEPAILRSFDQCWVNVLADTVAAMEQASQEQFALPLAKFYAS